MDAVLSQPKTPGSVLFDKGPCECADPLKAAHPNADYEACLRHGEVIGLGSRKYELIKI